MMFFANSGVAWPKLEQQTRQAGSDSLEAASHLWRFIARLERRQSEPIDLDDLLQCIEQLDRASRAYSKIASELTGEIVGGLTDSEFEAVGLRRGPYAYYDDWSLRSFLEEDVGVPIGYLYLDLSRRIELLASALRVFEPNREDRDLVPSVFGMMRQWERIATTGRIIAILNRRSATDGRESAAE
jgi:hypothetical protein